MRVAIAVGCVLISVVAGCSSRAPASRLAAAPRPAPAAIESETIPGIGATQLNWDASHTLNTANAGATYGNDPSLPGYLTENGAVYRDVDDAGTDRVHVYTLAMHTVDPEQAMRQLRQELPADATVAWRLTRDQCFRVAFNSSTLQAAGSFMAEAELQYIQQDGTPAVGPDRFNVASIFVEDVGTPPDPEKGC